MDVIIAPTKQNVILDGTVLSGLMNCARFSDLRYTRRFQSINGKSNSLEIGSIVHKVLEVFYKNKILGLKREDAINFALMAGQLYIQGCPHCTDFQPTEELPKPICGHPPNEYPGVKNTPLESEGYKVGWKYVLETCEQYFDFYKNDHWVPLEVETVKSEVIYEDDEIRVLWKAKFDLISDTNEGIYPIDHKSMKQNRSTTNLNNQFMGQCILMRTRRMYTNKVGFQKTLKPAEKFLRVPVNYTPARLMEWQSETLPYYAKLLLMYTAEGHFPPNYTNCQGKFGDCPFMEVCEANPERREEELKIGFIVGPEWNPTNDDND